MSETLAGLVEGGPKVVALGGGHGLACSLGACRRYAGRLTGIVSVADDGGSSGRLREVLGIPAPGDIRRCLGALLPEQSPIGRTLEHRFRDGQLENHAFGNLLLAALSATGEGFAAAVDEACQLLQTVGTVYPATNEPVVLRARTTRGAVRGQVAVMATAGVRRVRLEPNDATTPKGALEELSAADQIVIGPGSLFTSILATLAACAKLAEAVLASPAKVIYVCNLREQLPETAGFDAGMHLEALAAHGIVPDVMLLDPHTLQRGSAPSATKVREASLRRSPGESVHDQALLADALEKLLD